MSKNTITGVYDLIELLAVKIRSSHIEQGVKNPLSVSEYAEHIEGMLTRSDVDKITGKRIHLKQVLLKHFPDYKWIIIAELGKTNEIIRMIKELDYETFKNLADSLFDQEMFRKKIPEVTDSARLTANKVKKFTFFMLLTNSEHFTTYFKTLTLRHAEILNQSVTNGILKEEKNRFISILNNIGSEVANEFLKIANKDVEHKSEIEQQIDDPLPPQTKEEAMESVLNTLSSDMSPTMNIEIAKSFLSNFVHSFEEAKTIFDALQKVATKSRLKIIQSFAENSPHAKRLVMTLDPTSITGIYTTSLYSALLASTPEVFKASTAVLLTLYGSYSSFEEAKGNFHTRNAGLFRRIAEEFKEIETAANLGLAPKSFTISN